MPHDAPASEAIASRPGNIRERILALLQKRGFRLREEEVRVPVEQWSHGLRCDFLLERKKRRFAVALKTARGMADWLFHWIARPILALQAIQRLRGWEPLLAIHTETVSPQDVQRFKTQVALLAPDLWWILADAQGTLVAHLPSGEEETYRHRGDGQVWDTPSDHSMATGVLAPPVAYIGRRLTFTDLDQWLLKVWLLGPSAVEGWGGPRGSIRNLLQLAKLAEVAPPLVYRWAAALERSGYLRKWMRRLPLLQDGDALLAEWRGRYRLRDNEALPCDPRFGETLDDRFQLAFQARLRELRRSSLPSALTGHQACRAHHLRHSETRSIQLYVTGEPSRYLEPLQLVPSDKPAAPILLLRPKHERSVFRGALDVEGVAVCDILQVYLDLYHLADRGREQAEFLYERRLGAVLRATSEIRHGG